MLFYSSFTVSIQHMVSFSKGLIYSYNIHSARHKCDFLLYSATPGGRLTVEVKSSLKM